MSRLGTHSETEPIWAAVEVFSASAAMVGGVLVCLVAFNGRRVKQAQGWVYGLRDKGTQQPQEQERFHLYVIHPYPLDRARVRHASV
jgi:hypothetical protein